MTENKTQGAAKWPTREEFASAIECAERHMNQAERAPSGEAELLAAFLSVYDADPEGIDYDGAQWCIFKEGWLAARRATAGNAAPNCGACPGDGSICKTSCKLADESPVAGNAAAPTEAVCKCGKVLDDCLNTPCGVVGETGIKGLMSNAVAPGELSDERINDLYIEHAFTEASSAEIAFARAIEREVIAGNAGAAPAIPEGWKLVPEKVTPDMQRAYFAVIDKNLHAVRTQVTFGRWDSAREAYRAMLDAAPSPDTSPVGGKEPQA